ncbi:MAG: SAM-dependent chlorinase/fluorinase [Weeksellaceae bacterium]
MPIITLTTDFGLKDPYVSVIKGRIHCELENPVIIDISHEIQPFDVWEAAFVVKNAYRHFPKGTIHILGVDASVSPVNPPIATYIDDHYFICGNNGILSLIQSEIQPQEIVEINIPQAKKDTPFSLNDIFVPAACHLARGGKLSVIGQKIKGFKELASLQPVVKENNSIVGTVIYVDNFGNAITNISEKLFDKIGKKRSFRIWDRNNEFTTVYRNYHDFIDDFEREDQYIGRGMALFGSSGYLEIAIYKSNPRTFGSASTLYGFSKGSEIRVDFN